jgi:hypothetical protein
MLGGRDVEEKGWNKEDDTRIMDCVYSYLTCDDAMSLQLGRQGV